MRDGEERDKQTQAEVDVVQGRLAGRFGKMNSMAAKETVKCVLAVHDEIGDGAMEESHH